MTFHEAMKQLMNAVIMMVYMNPTVGLAVEPLGSSPRLHPVS